MTVFSLLPVGVAILAIREHYFGAGLPFSEQRVPRPDCSDKTPFKVPLWFRAHPGQSQPACLRFFGPAWPSLSALGIPAAPAPCFTNSANMREQMGKTGQQVACRIK